MSLSPQEKVLAARIDDRMFVVSGEVSTLYITDGTVNLLEGMQGKMAAAGLGSGLAGMAGGVANAAMVAMYDGEHVQHFGCYLGEQMVIGTFPDLGFKEGERVNAVVTRLDDHVVFAHAVVRVSDFKLWMPYSVDKGRYAIAAWIAKLMGVISLAAWAFIVSLYALSFPRDQLADEAFIAACGLIPIAAVISYLTYRSSPEGPYAERIFKVLGFKNPKVVNLAPYSESALNQRAKQHGGSLHVYDLLAAKRAHSAPRAAEPVEAKGP
jgi:hypothetical protein